MSAAQVEIADYSHPPRAKTLDERFSYFCAERPDVIKLLVTMARELRDAGENRIGMKMLFEVARFRHLVRRSTGKREPWLLNNSYTSRMARLIEDNYPDLKGLFEMRSLAQ